MTVVRAGRSRGREQAGGLSDRDWAILADLGRVRLLTGRHVQRLHLHNGSPLTQARRTRSTLQRLTNQGLLHRFGRNIGGVNAGSSGHVYGLATKGQRLLDRRGPAGGVRRRQPWEASTPFFDHILAVSEFYVRSREAEHRAAFDLLEFDAEPTCWRHWTDTSGSRLVLKPDAFVVAARKDLIYSTFIEVDLATESRTVIRRKGEAYVAYWQNGTEQVTRHVFPRVVWLVPDEHRRALVADGLSRADPEGWRLFQVAVFDHGLEQLVTEPP